MPHGHSYEDIAAALALSINTVRSHVRVIYERLGASTKVEAVMVGLELGLLEPTRLTSRPPPKPWSQGPIPSGSESALFLLTLKAMGPGASVRSRPARG